MWEPLVKIASICFYDVQDWKDSSDEDIISKLKKNIEEKVDIKIKYPHTLRKVLSMLNDLNSIGYATFIK